MLKKGEPKSAAEDEKAAKVCRDVPKKIYEIFLKLDHRVFACRTKSLLPTV